MNQLILSIVPSAVLFVVTEDLLLPLILTLGILIVMQFKPVSKSKTIKLKIH